MLLDSCIRLVFPRLAAPPSKGRAAQNLRHEAKQPNLGPARAKMSDSLATAYLVLFLTILTGVPKGFGAMADSETNPHLLGGVHESVGGAQNSEEVEQLGRFAVDEHNKKENARLEFVGVVKAKEQVVAGTLHHLTLEAIEAGKKNLYEAKVWVKPWLDFKEVQEFRHSGEATSFTTADLGAKKGGHEAGWRDVPIHDPVVKDAVSHAIKSIQERSNSLFPYELLEVLHAKAEVVEDFAKFNILMKLKRGSKAEKFHVEVHKSLEGAFVVNQMQQEHDESSSQ